MNLPVLTPEEQNQFNNGVVQVNAKAMNRTALGIIDAYLLLNPNTTFAELKQAFPDSLNPTAPKQAPKSIFKPYTDKDFGVVHSLQVIQNEFAKAELPYDGLFFLEESEKFTTFDGVTVVVNRLWESRDAETNMSDVELLASQAIKYGIVVNKFPPKNDINRERYSIDILNSLLFDKISGKVQPTSHGSKKAVPFWLWISLLLLLIALIIWFIRK
jgi:hypothetical protein